MSVVSQEQPGEGNAVTHWNAIASELMVVEGPVLDLRAFAIFQAAVHDAVNGVERRYEPYTADVSSPGASVEAAVATAARDVLLALSPSQQEQIEADYAAALAAVPNGPAKDEGVILGRQCAQANLDRRADDGIATVAEPVYVPTGEPGDYDFTPPFDRPPLGPIALFPGAGRLKPFGIDLAEHRLRGSDRLSSRRYAFDLNYVKSIGSLDSPTRTADQTEIAFFWFVEVSIWNRIANTFIRRSHVDIWRSARILALTHFAIAMQGSHPLRPSITSASGDRTLPFAGRVRTETPSPRRTRTGCRSSGRRPTSSRRSSSFHQFPTTRRLPRSSLRQRPRC
jgi:hypothetical protein